MVEVTVLRDNYGTASLSVKITDVTAAEAVAELRTLVEGGMDLGADNVVVAPNRPDPAEW